MRLLRNEIAMAEFIHGMYSAASELAIIDLSDSAQITFFSGLYEFCLQEIDNLEISVNKLHKEMILKSYYMFNLFQERQKDCGNELVGLSEGQKKEVLFLPVEKSDLNNLLLDFGEYEPELRGDTDINDDERRNIFAIVRDIVIDINVIINDNVKNITDKECRKKTKNALKLYKDVAEELGEKL